MNPNIKKETPVQELGFSPSQFLNTSMNKNEIYTSTPAKSSLFGNRVTPLITPVGMSKTNKKRGSSGLDDSSFLPPKRPLVSTTPRTPTPLKVAVKTEQGFSKNPTMDEISVLLQQKPKSILTTPDHDYAKYVPTLESCKEYVPVVESCNELSDTTTTTVGKDSLRRTLFETPCQNQMLRTCGVNLFSEKELNAIEQMSTCFTPRKLKMAKLEPNQTNQNLRLSEHSNFIINPTSQIDRCVPTHQVKILPLVGKPLKLPIKRLPPRNLNFKDYNTPTYFKLTDAFKSIAYGQSYDQKFLTEQARLIMKEINNANIKF